MDGDLINSSSIRIRKLVYGLGINDSRIKTYEMVGGKKVENSSYTCWRGMIRRCSDRDRFPTYSDVMVCSEWIKFSAFNDWWEKNHVIGWEIDKDIISDKRIYSPETCIFVPPWVNSIINDSRKSRGDLPIGVSFRSDRGVYQAYITINGRQKSLGHHQTIDNASAAWLDAKKHYIETKRTQMDAIDKRIYPRIIDIISSQSRIS